MTLPQIPGPIAYVGTPPLVFRFGVLFLAGGVFPNPLDTMFQKVSGIGATVETDTIEEGGQNLYTQKVPKKISYENLVLERGLVVGSPLSIEFNVAMSRFKYAPSTVMITLLDHTNLPVSTWLFMKAFPVRWRVSDLDATSNSVAIETLELAYQRFQTLKL
jgi:phage tail-like protein